MYATLYPNDALPRSRVLFREALTALRLGLGQKMWGFAEAGFDIVAEILAARDIGKYVRSVTLPVDSAYCRVFSDNGQAVITGWMDAGDGIGVMLRPGGPSFWFWAENPPRSLEDLPEFGSKRLTTLDGPSAHGHATAMATILRQRFARRFPELAPGRAN